MEMPTNIDSIITERARHFGRGDRHGGWLFAADIACCVQNAGRGRRPDPATGKVSAAGFAELAGRAPGTVRAYLAAWELAAERGLVPPADSLTPDSDPALPSAEQWLEFYHDPDGAWGRARQEESQEALPRAARSRGPYQRRGAVERLADMEKDARAVIRDLAENRGEAETVLASITRIRGSLDTAVLLVSALAGQ
jgi:hypothetical protein